MNKQKMLTMMIDRTEKEKIKYGIMQVLQHPQSEYKHLLDFYGDGDHALIYTGVRKAITSLGNIIIYNEKEGHKIEPIGVKKTD